MDADLRYFTEHGIKKLPMIKTVQGEIEALIEEKNALYSRYRVQKQQTRELQNVRDNIYRTLSIDQKSRTEEVR